MGLTVLAAHHPRFLIICILFFIAFYEVTEDYQGGFSLRASMLVGLFLAGLVLHGGLQQWWIAPVLGRLGELPLFLGAIGLTAFNDNAAITYLSTLVPDLSDPMKYAVVSGAVTGGGLTVIANAPNPAGQSILQGFFEDGISPLGLFLGALLPTTILALGFLWLG
jgi:Na+/H+ antiporter NhaD/arsenite permease-like protein